MMNVSSHPPYRNNHDVVQLDELKKINGGHNQYHHHHGPPYLSSPSSSGGLNPLSSSSSSSMNTFMSDLLGHKKKNQNLQINIIDDNAKQDQCLDIRLVKLRHSRSLDKQVNRWCCDNIINNNNQNQYQHKHKQQPLNRIVSDLSLTTNRSSSRKSISSSSSSKPKNSSSSKMMRASASDTMLLKMPTRKLSPRIVKPGIGSSSLLLSNNNNNNNNATWDIADLNNKSPSLNSNKKKNRSSSSSSQSLKDRASLLGLQF